MILWRILNWCIKKLPRPRREPGEDRLIGTSPEEIAAIHEWMEANPMQSGEVFLNGKLIARVVVFSQDGNTQALDDHGPGTPLDGGQHARYEPSADEPTKTDALQSSHSPSEDVAEDGVPDTPAESL